MKEMKIEFINKRGEMTSKQLVSLILIIAAFVIIMIVAMITWKWGGETITKEECHESIVLRSAFNFGLANPGQVIPLRCATEKICLSQGGSDCREFGVSTKKNPVTKVKLSSDDERAKTEIMDNIANMLYECNSMLGEGKLNFMETKTSNENYCLICSRFSVDADAGSISEIKFVDLYKHLAEKKDDAGRSYLEFLYPGWSDWRKIYEIFEYMKKIDGKAKDAISSTVSGGSIENWKIEINEKRSYAVIGQMGKEGTQNAWIASTIVGVGTTLLLKGIGGPIGFGFAAKVGAVAGSITFFYLDPSQKYQYSTPVLIPYDLENLRNLKCTTFSVS